MSDKTVFGGLRENHHFKTLVFFLYGHVSINRKYSFTVGPCRPVTQELLLDVHALALGL